MGDIGALIKGVKSIAIGVTVGTVHGFIDGYGDINKTVPYAAHEIMTYGPAVFSGIYVGTEPNGQWTKSAMIKGGLAFAGLTALSTGAGYVIGRVIGGGIEKLI